MKNQVLIIDSDIKESKEIKYSLQDKNTNVYYTASAKEALSLFASHTYALVIMDIEHSETNGMELLQSLHKKNPVPILVLSSHFSKREECEVLHAGADKYLGKPLDLERCLAHARAIMRRYMLGTQPQGSSYILVTGSGLKIDVHAHRVFWNEKKISLTPIQYRLLCSLANHMGEVLTKEQMYATGWDEDFEVNIDEAVKYQIKELRRKFGKAGAGDLIETVWGIGYQLTLEEK